MNPSPGFVSLNTCTIGVPATRRVEITSCCGGERRKIRPRHRAPPHSAAQLFDDRRRIARQHDGALIDDRHPVTELTHVVDDVRRQYDDDVLADLTQQVEEPPALGRIETRRRLIDDQQSRTPGQCDRDAESLLHPARESADFLAPHVVQIRLLQQRLHQVAPLASHRHALQLGEVIEHGLRGLVGIQPELLRQIPEVLAHFGRLGQHVDCLRAGSFRESGRWSVAMVRISVDLPAPLGPSSPNIPGATLNVTSRRARTPLS